MNEKQKLEETIIKNLKNEVTILNELPHGKGIKSELDYINIHFHNIFEKIEGYENPYEGIIRVEKKRMKFGNKSQIDNFQRNNRYDYEKNIRKIVKDEIDENFEYYCNTVSRYIKELMEEHYIAQELHMDYHLPIHQVQVRSIPDNMEYEEHEEYYHSCSGDITYRLRERLLHQILYY